MIRSSPICAAYRLHRRFGGTRMRLLAAMSTFRIIVGALLLVLAGAEAFGEQRDSALERLIDERIAAAELFYQAFAQVRIPAPGAIWDPAADRLFYPTPENGGTWHALDAAKGTDSPLSAPPSVQGSSGPFPPPPALQTAFGPPVGPEWRADSVPLGFTIKNSSGETVATFTGEERYPWFFGPSSTAPDRSFLLAMRIDNRKVHSLPIIDYSGQLEQVQHVPYAKTGSPLPVTELYLVDPKTRTSRQVRLDPAEAYIFPIGWTRDAREALALRLTRDAKTLELIGIDAATAATRTIVADQRPETFVAGLELPGTVGLQVTLLPDGRHFLWMSERDGWRHAYLYQLTGKLVGQVTRGPMVVHRVAATDGESVFFIASPDSQRPYDRHLFRVSLDGKTPRQLTTDPGEHDAQFSPSRKFYLHRHSGLDRAPQADLRRADGSLVRTLGRMDVAPLMAVGRVTPEPLTAVGSDGKTRIHGVLYKPAGFDATRTYPVLEYIYGGQFTYVTQVAYMPSTMQRLASTLAQMGFVVAMLDAPGTIGRGKAFQDATYGRVGQTEIADHVAALQFAARTRPYMDMSRVGIVGHSWGGYFAIRAMLQAPEFYRASYAGAPGELTEAALINEPYMGLYESNRAGYDSASNPRLAGNLRGPLKLMHGTSDQNATMSTTMHMVDALVKAGKQFDMLILPGQPHAPVEPFARHYRQDTWRFMARHLLQLPGAGPA
jgi:dipeptidyl aminopeptidase/acylaminoacyl peptidase